MTTSLVGTRTATSADVAAVHALYDRCSPASLERRFHVPVARLPERQMRRLVAPPDGWSLLAEHGDEVVGHGCAGRLDASTVEIGVLVDDTFQRRPPGHRVPGRRLGRDPRAAADGGRPADPARLTGRRRGGWGA